MPKRDCSMPSFKKLRFLFHCWQNFWRQFTLTCLKLFWYARDRFDFKTLKASSEKCSISSFEECSIWSEKCSPRRKNCMFLNTFPFWLTSSMEFAVSATHLDFPPFEKPNFFYEVPATKTALQVYWRYTAFMNFGFSICSRCSSAYFEHEDMARCSAVVGGSGCRVHSIPDSWFGFRAQVSIKPSNLRGSATWYQICMGFIKHRLVQLDWPHTRAPCTHRADTPLTNATYSGFVIKSWKERFLAPLSPVYHDLHDVDFLSGISGNWSRNAQDAPPNCDLCSL